MTTPLPHLAGAIVAFTIAASIAATFWWMLHPPQTRAEQAARETEADVEELIGSVLIVFSSEIHSEHMTALAARLARKERAQLYAIYIIEVPLTLPMDAAMTEERRHALDVLATAEAIARKNQVEITTEIVPARKVSDGALLWARRVSAHLIVLGSYREGRYMGAPIGKAIEAIAAQSPCDVIIGVPGLQSQTFSPLNGNGAASATATAPLQS